jgi:hypothetical protein
MWTLVLLVAGIWVVDRLNKLPLVFAFLGAYFAIFSAVSRVNAAAVAEMFRDPFVQSAIFLAFFMLTDPPTSPNRYQDQVGAAARCRAGLPAAGCAGRQRVVGSPSSAYAPGAADAHRAPAGHPGP